MKSETVKFILEREPDEKSLADKSTLENVSAQNIKLVSLADEDLQLRILDVPHPKLYCGL